MPTDLEVVRRGYSERKALVADKKLAWAGAKLNYITGMAALTAASRDAKADYLKSKSDLSQYTKALATIKSGSPISDVNLPAAVPSPPVRPARPVRASRRPHHECYDENGLVADDHPTGGCYDEDGNPDINGSYDRHLSLLPGRLA